MSGKTEVGPTNTRPHLTYNPVIFFGLTQYELAIDHLLSGEISFGLVKVSSLQDLLSNEMLTLLRKTASCNSSTHRFARGEFLKISDYTDRPREIRTPMFCHLLHPSWF